MTKVIDTEVTSLNIKKQMVLKGVSVKDVAEALNMESVHSVYRWINPNSSVIPSIDNIVLLAEYFQVDINDIIFVKEI